MLLAGAALALLLALWLVVRRRAQHAEEASDSASRYTAMGGVGRMGEDTPGRSEPLTAHETRNEPAPAVPQATPVPAPATSPLPLDSAPQAETISEAEIYLAYGRYDQARERLVQSLAADPERHDLRLKLLTACVALGDHDAAEQEAAYLDAHGDEQQRAEAREILARLVPDSSVPAASSAIADPSPEPIATEADEPSDTVVPAAPGSGEPQAAGVQPEAYAGMQEVVQEEAQEEAQGEDEALSGLADAAVASNMEMDDGRVIDYQPPSLDLEPERRGPELGQPVVDFPGDPLGLGSVSPDIDDDHATLADAEPVARGESSPATATSDWIIEEVAFDPLDLDNERFTTHASPVDASNAADQLDYARQRLDRGEHDAALRAAGRGRHGRR